VVADKAIIERNVKRIITVLHQDVYGKGPEELWAKVNRNIVTFSCTRTLTPLEKFLLGTHDGKTQILNLRENVSRAIKDKLCREINVSCNVKVLSIVDEIEIDTDVWFGAILLSENVE